MSNTLGVGDVVAVGHYCRQNDQVAINVLHYRIGAITGVGVTDQEVADAQSASAATVYKPILSTSAKFEGVRVQRVFPSKLPYVTSVVGSGAGTNVSDPLPTQAALLVEKRTNTVTMGAYGRAFVPFWCEDCSGTDGRPNGTATTLATNWINLLLMPSTIVGAGGTANFNPVVFSRKFNAPKDITSTKVNASWATHKSRSQINKGDSFAP